LATIASPCPEAPATMARLFFPAADKPVFDVKAGMVRCKIDFHGDVVAPSSQQFSKRRSNIIVKPSGLNS
jgi:hypothetical protein